MKRVTRSIVLSVVFVAVLVAVSAISTGLWFFLSHRDSISASAQLADAEFSQLRGRFAHQQPLIDMSRRRRSRGRRREPWRRSAHFIPLFLTRAAVYGSSA